MFLEEKTKYLESLRDSSKGEVYRVYYYESLGAASMDIVIVVGAKPIEVIKLEGGSDDTEFDIFLYKADTLGAAGTAIVPVNLNRARSANLGVALTTIDQGTTITGAGTLLETSVLVTTTKDYCEKAPMVFEAAGQYRVRITNVNAGPSRTWVDMIFKELP